MIRIFVAGMLFLGTAVGAAAQQRPPLPPDAGPGAIQPEPLPPLPPAPSEEPAARPGSPTTAPLSDMPPAAAPPGAGPQESREFCSQSVTFALAPRDSVAPRYRDFVGIWSDASWTPQLCAALVVENVRPDGTASILYIFGPMSPSARQTGGILRGTGIVRDGQLLFQNSDGSQFAFRPLYADLDGHLTTPKGQSYQAVFKKTL